MTLGNYMHQLVGRKDKSFKREIFDAYRELSQSGKLSPISREIYTSLKAIFDHLYDNKASDHAKSFIARRMVEIDQKETRKVDEKRRRT